MAFGYNPEEIVLTPEEEEAARQAAAGSTPPPAAPPPYDPAQDTQGMQAQPTTITLAPTATEAAKSPEASYAYREAAGSPYIDTGSAPPESTQQTITDPVPDPPPPYTQPLHPYDDWHNFEAPPPTEAPRTSVLGPLQTPADALWKALDMRFSIGDPVQRYQDAEAAYATGRETAPLHKRGEGYVQTLVDLEHSGLGQFLGGAYGDAQERNKAIAAELEPQAPYGPPSDQGQATQMAGAGVGQAKIDQRVPFPGPTPGYPELPEDRLRRKFGRVGSWYETPTTPGSLSQPPADTNTRGTDPVQAALGFARFLKDFGPGGQGNLVGDVVNDVLPYKYSDMDVLSDTLTVGGETPFPEALQHLVPLARHALFRGGTNTLTPENQEVMDRTDAYVGADREYLGRMAALPWYLRPLRPAIARGVHALTAAPYPGWIPINEGEPLPPWLQPQPDREVPNFSGTEHIEPGVYYDDPYIPGPDKGPRRRTA